LTDGLGAGMMNKLGANHENLDHKVYKEMRSMIFGQQLKPGEKIYQEKLAEALGVSRTPVVSALKKLEQERLITAVPRKGFYVRRFSKEEMIRIFELREVLEGLAARRASQRITENQIQSLRGFFKGFKISESPRDIEKYAEEDRRFHHFLIEIGGDELLSGILESYRIVTFSYLVGFTGGLVRSPRETLPEHLAIIEALVRKDPEKSEQTARRHLKRSWEKLFREFEREMKSRSQKGEGSQIMPIEHFEKKR
jgi:DNA-binding GntR family transcriptional regulator